MPPKQLQLHHRQLLLKQLLLILCFVVCVQASKCPAGWLDRPNTQWCYHLSNSAANVKSWSEAKAACSLQHGDLLSVEDKDESKWIITQIDRYKSNDKHWWIGLKRESSGAQWMWDDGHGSETPDSVGKGALLTWVLGNDIDGPGDCMTVKEDVSNDYMFVQQKNCEDKYKYICKKMKRDNSACDSDNGWQMHGSRCFKATAVGKDEQGYTWSEARQKCLTDEADLVSISNKETNTVVRDMISNNGAGSYWIGLHPKSSDAGAWTWQWSDGLNLTYESWLDGKRPSIPDGQGNNFCIRTEGTDVNALWKSYSCDQRFGFVCAKSAGSCASTWYAHRDECLGFSKRLVSWELAEQTCRSYGADLLQIKQRHKQDFINRYKDELSQENVNFIWIGLNKQSTDTGELTWTTGGKASDSFTNWRSGEPNLQSGRDNAVRIVSADDDGRWEVANPVNEGGFVCQLPLGQEPIVPTTPYPLYSCQDGWILFRTNCYKFEYTSRDWLTAEKRCKTDYPGAALVDVRDSGEQAFLQSEISYFDFWIGLHRRTGSGQTWVWSVDDTRATYFNWNTGEPSNTDGEENCVEIYAWGPWNDNKCTWKLPSICKQPAIYRGSPPTAPGPVTTTDTWDPFCGPGWTRDPLSNYCYLFNADLMVWLDAKHQCEFAGGNLISILTHAEKTYVAGRLQSFLANNPNLIGMWIGFNDREEEARWVWDDQKPVTYINWAEGEPNNAHPDGEDCAIIRSTNYQWLDVPCSLRYGSICKKRGNGLVTVQPPLTTIQVPDGYERGCRDGYEEYNNMCYKANATYLTWTQARDTCRFEGGDLVSVHSQTESQFVLELAKKSGVPSEYWIGFYNTMTLPRTQYFQWSDLTSPKFTNWDLHEPNNFGGKEGCAHAIFHRNAQWNDIDCNRESSFVCKQKRIPVKIIQPTTRPSGCPAEYDSAYDGYCLKFVVGNERLEANQVKAKCEAIGGKVATIISQDVQNHFQLKISELNSPYSYWIGITRQTYFYRWDDGRPVSYTNWKPTHNFFGTRGYMSASTGEWDMSDSFLRLSNYICQKEQEGYSTTPAPTTTYNPEYCATGWIEVDDQCYRGFRVTIADKRLTWAEARSQCKTLNGELASINNNNVTEMLKQTIGGTSAYWIGLNRRDSNKDYEWSNGDPVNYFQWRGDSQPENINGNQNCVVLNPSDMKWTLQNCNAAANWLCQTPKGIYPTGSTPEPTTEPDLPDCGDGWKYHDGSCYLFNTDIADWHDSLTKCREMGGDLASIHDLQANEFILRLSSKMHLTATSYWIGLNELGVSDGYRWSDGSAVNFVNWNSGEPNNHGGAEHCVSFYANNGLWNDEQCGIDMRSICKRNNDTTSPPTATPLPGNCPEGFYTVGDKCYRIYEKVAITWDEAKNACMEAVPGRRSYLASISNQYEQAALSAIRMETDVSLWIGLRARGFGHQYFWLDNSAVSFTNWDFGEPNGYRDYCVEMYSEKYRSGKWNDARCESKRGYICMTYKDASLSTQWPAPTSVSCPEGWTPYGMNCYRFVAQASTWKGAEASCTTLGGHITSIHDLKEQNYLHYQTGLIGELATWIGLSNTQSTNKGVYQWSNNWPVTYTYWGRNQPSEVESDSCVYTDEEGRWFDDKCDSKRPYWCRISYGVAPTLHPEIEGTCLPQFEPFGSDCYYFADNGVRASAQQAQYECTRFRANLVSILSPAEQDFVAGRVKEKVENQRYRSDYWIGLLRTYEGGFEWSDKNPLGFAYWSRNEPSNGPRETCVEMYHGNTKWNDHFCTKSNSYICKMPKMPSTGPTTATTDATTTTTRKPVTTTTSRTTALWTSTATEPQGLTTVEEGQKGIGAVSSNPLVLLLIVVFVVLLIGLVAAVLVYRRLTRRKADEPGFANANWSRSNDTVRLEESQAAATVGNLQLEEGVENPNFNSAT